MTVLECLIAARKRIENPEKWGKGPEIFALDPKDNKDCAEWDLYRARTINHAPEVWAAIVLLKQVVKKESLVFWNDAPERTHEDVLKAYEKAIELARQSA